MSEAPLSSSQYLFLFQFLIVVPYHPAWVAVAQTINTYGTLIWNYNDLFIILVSDAVAQLFKQLNDKLDRAQLKASLR